HEYKVKVQCVLTCDVSLRTASPAKHWRRAPARGVFNVDLYAYNKPRMNLARRQLDPSRSVAPPLMGHLLEQISQHSRRSADPRSHFRNLEDEVATLPMPMALQEHEIEEPAINMQLMPLQVNSSLHARSNLYSSEFHVQNIGSKKIVQLNTLTLDHERKPVVEEVIAQQSKRQQEQEEQQEREPLKVKLTLPELPENNAAEEAETEQDTINGAAADTLASEAPSTTVVEWESPASVKKTMAPSGTIIDTASAGMQPLVSQSAAQNADDNSTKSSSGPDKKSQDETRARPARPKTRRKQTPSKGTRGSNETDTKMTASPAVSAASLAAVSVSGTAKPILGTIPGPGSAKQPAKESETQSPEISTHHPLATPSPSPSKSKNRSKSKSKGKGKGKDKRRQGIQRRPVSGAMEEEIETTTNWWQILPYAEIRKFLNTIYDTIADDIEDERAKDDV
ncbi:hypothetical protein KR018_007487, partial [Drosophila ironensis]